MALSNEDKAFLIKIGQIVPEEPKATKPKTEPTTEKVEE